MWTIHMRDGSKIKADYIVIDAGAIKYGREINGQRIVKGAISPRNWLTAVRADEVGIDNAA